MTALQPRTREAVLKIAAWQLGVLESPAGSNAVKYNEAFYGRRVAGSAYPWCLAFVWWVFREAGFSLAKTASCSELRRRYQAAGQWVTEGYRPGDILLFDFSGRRAKTEHAGILERVEPDGTLVTLEGNTGAGSDANGGAVPDSLVQCTLGAGGVEALLLAAIKVSKVLSGQESGREETE